MKYNFPSAVEGDTTNAVDFEILVNDVALDLTGTTITMHFRDKFKSLAQEFTSSSGITITSAVEGKFTLDSFVVTLNPGRYIYDIEFDTAGVKKTYIEGEFVVRPQITQ